MTGDRTRPTTFLNRLLYHMLAALIALLLTTAVACQQPGNEAPVESEETTAVQKDVPDQHAPVSGAHETLPPTNTPETPPTETMVPTPAPTRRPTATLRPAPTSAAPRHIHRRLTVQNGQTEYLEAGRSPFDGYLNFQFSSTKANVPNETLGIDFAAGTQIYTYFEGQNLQEFNGSFPVEQGKRFYFWFDNERSIFTGKEIAIQYHFSTTQNPDLYIPLPGFGQYQHTQGCREFAQERSRGELMKILELLLPLATGYWLSPAINIIGELGPGESSEAAYLAISLWGCGIEIPDPDEWRPYGPGSTNCNLHNILAVAFTNKATEEMAFHLKQMLPRGRDHPEVRTFHSFAAALLRRPQALSYEDPDYQILNPGDQREMLKEAAKLAGVKPVPTPGKQPGFPDPQRQEPGNRRRRLRPPNDPGRRPFCHRGAGRGLRPLPAADSREQLPGLRRHPNLRRMTAGNRRRSPPHHPATVRTYFGGRVP